MTILMLMKIQIQETYEEAGLINCYGCYDESIDDEDDDDDDDDDGINGKDETYKWKWQI